MCGPAEPLLKTRGKVPRAVNSAVAASRKELETDALLASMIRTVEELEGLVSMLGAFGSDEDTPRRISLASELREIAGLFDRLPMLENDLRVIKRRIRGMLSTDPDKTPRAISITELQAVTEETRFEPVEEERRRQTAPGIGIPMPKKDR